MNNSLRNRIGKALLFAIFITGVLYVTGYEKFDKGSLPLMAKIALSVFLQFLIIFGVLNLVHIYKNKTKNQD